MTEPLAHHSSRAHRRPDVRLSRRHERLVLAVAATVSLSGLGWVLVHYFVARQDDFGVVHDASEPWLLRLHGAAAMAALVLLGSLTRDHALNAWRQGRHRLSGGTLTLACVVLIATGYALYYVASEALRPWISALHWAIGISAMLAFVAHRAGGRRPVHSKRPPARTDHWSRRPSNGTTPGR